MSIIYEALKKVEGRKKTSPLEDIPETIVSLVEETEEAKAIEKVEVRAGKSKKMFSLPLILLLGALGISVLSFVLSSQRQDGEAMIVKKNEIDPARVYKIPQSGNQALEEVTLRDNSIQEYILEGIVYDSSAPFALINGKVINESDSLGNFRIDKISENKVEMINTQDDSIVTLSLFN